MDGGQNVQHLAGLILTQSFLGNGSFCLVRCLHLSKDRQASQRHLTEKMAYLIHFSSAAVSNTQSQILLNTKYSKYRTKVHFRLQKISPMVRKQHSTREQREGKKTSNCLMFLWNMILVCPLLHFAQGVIADGTIMIFHYYFQAQKC